MPTPTPQTTARLLLASALAFAGLSHLTFARKPFQAQVPDWLPLPKDTVVLASGLAELTLGASLALAPEPLRPLTGAAAAGFFTAIFPGNIHQYTHHLSAFGLDTDSKRFARLFFQPVLVAWALWSTGAVGRE